MIRIIQIEKGEGTTLRTFKKYLGCILGLPFDPGQWRWKGGGILHSYSMKKGRFMHKPREVLSRPIPLKWHGMVAADYTRP
jgi:hypothetical protein